MDYSPVLPETIEIEDDGGVTIGLRTRNDAITLQYDDPILLVFSLDDTDIFEDEEEIRNMTTVHIIDNDRK